MTRTGVAFIVTLLIIAGPSHLRGQVCGISGAKLNTLSADVIDHHSLEFEVLYGFEKSLYMWDHEGTLSPIADDSMKDAIGSGLQYRATFGLFRNTEIGASVDHKGEQVSLGFKWMPVRMEKSSVALAGGLNFRPAEAVQYQATEGKSYPTLTSAALLFSHELTASLSVDVNVGYNMVLSGTEEPYQGFLDLCCDCGWLLFDGKLQAVLGAGFKSGISPKDQERFSLLSLYPGITVRAGRDYEVLIALPRDIYGINHLKRKLVVCALTMTLR